MVLDYSVQEFHHPACIRGIAKAISPLVSACDFRHQDTKGNDTTGRRSAESRRDARMVRARIGG
jgi:hypothetical protein